MDRSAFRASYAVAKVARQYPDLDNAHIANRLRSSTYVSWRNRYLYFEVPKAACSSLKYLVHRIEGCPPLPPFDPSSDISRRDEIIHVREHVTIPSLVDLRNEQQEEALESPDFLRLVVVRNPYSRLVSAWRGKVLVCEPGFEGIYRNLRGELPEIASKSLISFEEFVGYLERHEDLDSCNPHWRRQTAHVFWPAMNFNFVGKTEKLDEALRRLERQVGADHPIEIPLTNASASTKDPLLTPALARRISILYRQDFEAFGYEPEITPPIKSNGTVSEELLHDEIVERNLVIASLHAEVERLRQANRGLLARLRSRFAGLR